MDNEERNKESSPESMEQGSRSLDALNFPEDSHNDIQPNITGMSPTGRFSVHKQEAD